MVFQNYALFPHMSVERNVAYGLKVRGITSDERKRKVQRALDVVHMTGSEKRLPNQLSGGQQQRVALARALVIEPDVLLLDEPLSNLDAKLRLEMREEIRRIHRETGVTAIYVTHDQKEALSIADRLAVMRDGRIEQVGSPHDVYSRPANAFVAGFIGETNFLPCEAIRCRPDEIQLHSPWGSITSIRPHRGLEASQEVIASIRPEAIVIREDRGPALPGEISGPLNCLRGKVVSVTYLGDQVQYALKLNPDHEMKVTILNPAAQSPFAVHARVAIEFRPEDVSVFDVMPKAVSNSLEELPSYMLR